MAARLEYKTPGNKRFESRDYFIRIGRDANTDSILTNSLYIFSPIKGFIHFKTGTR